jgi:hypothetical protein
VQQETANKILDRWVQLIGRRDLDGVVALYDESAVLIPTFSNRLLSTPGRIREYFEMLCNRDELAISVHEKPRIESTIGGSLRALAGIYRWRFAVEGEPLDFEARFSFLLDLDRPTPILHHHSSQIPRML